MFLFRITGPSLCNIREYSGSRRASLLHIHPLCSLGRLPLCTAALFPSAIRNNGYSIPVSFARVLRIIIPFMYYYLLLFKFLFLYGNLSNMNERLLPLSLFDALGNYLVAVCPGSSAPSNQLLIHNIKKQRSIKPLRRRGPGALRDAAFHPQKPWLVVAYTRGLR